MDAPAIQNMLGAAGSCPQIDFKGKTWKIGHPTQRAKACLEQLVIAKATREITSLKGVIDSISYKELFDAHLGKIHGGSFKTWAEGWQQTACSAENSHLFLLSLLRENHSEASEADAHDMTQDASEQIQVALAQIVPDFFIFLIQEHPIMDLLRRNKLKPEQQEMFRKSFLETVSPIMGSLMGKQKEAATKVFSTLGSLLDEPTILTSAS